MYPDTSPMSLLGNALGIDTRTASQQERDRLAQNTTYIQQAEQRTKALIQSQAEAARRRSPQAGGPFNPINVPM